ncbi:MAG: peptidoglycan bridge formation glycyltransferase FemA/FemB family protein [Spirochaetes bacterium]|nr:peptidoglycan bridge formation glycyltransferase FemA/FemB family protein [Spirochaetota bacterium]
MTVRAIDISEISTTRNLMQSARWARAKQKRGREVRPFWVSSIHGAGSAVVILQPFSAQYRLGYLPWGPDLRVPAPSQGPVLEELAEELRRQLPDDILFLRFDLPWRSPFDLEAQAEEGEHREEPVELPPPWVRALRMNFDTQEHALRKAPTDVQPADTVLIDLQKSNAELLADMRAKTRYNLRLAGRRGVVVEQDGVSALEEWYELYRETMARSGTSLHDPAHFHGLLTTPPDGRVGIHLLMARTGAGEAAPGHRLAGLILAVAGDYAVYLYGASGGRERWRMPTYLLQWKAMQLARNLGAKTYDLFGVPSDSSPGHPMHGLLRYKTGFGGHLITRRGCWDYPLNAEIYDAVSGQELAAPGYHGS